MGDQQKPTARHSAIPHIYAVIFVRKGRPPVNQEVDLLGFIGNKKKRPEGWRSAPIPAEKNFTCTGTQVQVSGRCTNIIFDNVYYLPGSGILFSPV